ncbi:hypothetical protein JCM10207_003776 [Rhodosporidiobolus poonsookiae]
MSAAAPPPPPPPPVGTPHDSEVAPRRKNQQSRKASCENCRRRRIRCDRGHPCGGCAERDDTCVWDADALTPLNPRDEQEHEAMREEIRHLRNLVDLLSAEREAAAARPYPFPGRLPLGFPPHGYLPPPGHAHPLGPPPHGPPPPFGFAPRPLARPPPPPPPPAPAAPSPAEEPLGDLEANDLARKLGELTISVFEVEVRAENAGKSHAIIEEARQLIKLNGLIERKWSSGEQEQPFSTGTALFSVTTSGGTSAESPLCIPAKEVIDTAVNAHFEFTGWYLPAITRECYQKHEDAVLDAVKAAFPPRPLSLAVCSAVWAFGLFSAHALECVWAGTPEQRLSLKLAEQSRACLAPFVERPALDSVRALMFLAVYYTSSTSGEMWGVGLEMVSLAVNASLKLELHRDSDDTPGLYSFKEAEERRRLFHAVLSKDREIGCLLGRQYTQLRAAQTNTKVPLNLHDEQLDEIQPVSAGEETVMTPLLIFARVGRVAEMITDEMFSGVRSITYSRVLELDKALRKLQEDLPSIYKLQFAHGASTLMMRKVYVINMVILHNLVRLHRPFLCLAYTDDKFAFSRTACLDAAVTLVESQRALVPETSCASSMYAGLSAAITICIDLLYGPPLSRSDLRETLVDDTRKRLEPFTKVSRVVAVSDNQRRLVRLVYQPRRTRTSTVFLRAPARAKTPSSARPRSSPRPGAPIRLPSIAAFDALSGAPPVLRSPGPSAHPSRTPHLSPDELAAFDFPSLLGLDKDAAPFTFGTSSSGGVQLRDSSPQPVADSAAAQRANPPSGRATA